jgi:hypothetical protein
LKVETPAAGFAVIVYPEESGTLFAAAFLPHHIQCLCIMPQRACGDEIKSKDYHLVIPDDGDLSRLLTVLNQYPLLCVLAGSERGVPLADKISTALNLLPNDPQHAQARCSKSIMATTASKAGLAIPWQTTVTSDIELKTLIANGVAWPVIIKPDNSMGSEGVRLCANAEALTAAFASILHQNNRLDRINRQCIVQEYMRGTEYAIDTVSYAGNHRVSAIWQYHKSGTDIIGIVPFHSKRLLGSQGEIPQRLLNYTYALLDALGIQYGPAHTELVLGDGNGDENGDEKVQLMELGARLHGGHPAMAVSHACSGQSQIELCALAYAKPQSFLNQQVGYYPQTAHGEIVLLIAPQSGLYANPACVATIGALPSVASITIATTQALGRIAGLVILRHVDGDCMNQDRQTLRELEASDLYVSDPSPIGS